MNNLLRASADQTEIFYCQPYFKALFGIIKELYKEQKSKSNQTFYRGGCATEQEISKYQKSKGYVIQNLGFLSTTSDQNQAADFINNIKFVITVDPEQKDQTLDYGYAQISDYSYYPNEK